MTPEQLRRIGMLRQWLNEDRITEPNKMVSNEDLMYWLTSGDDEELHPYNREALLDCLIDNKCDGLTARDLVLWGNAQYEKGRENATGV